MHLKSLQALEMSIRTGSLKAAADALGITPAAVGQRIRALENFLGNDLLLRGRSGLQPTDELRRALADLKTAFAALERVTETLEFDRVTEVHVVADPDWAELWLAPRLPAFRADHPNIRFCINGEGDVPMRLGAPDCRINYGGPELGDALFTDKLVPLCSQDNLRRLADWDDVAEMEGLPLLHLKEQREDPERPGWPDWFATYGHRRSGQERGVLYPHMRTALEGMRDDVGFLLCGLSLGAPDIAAGKAFILYPAHMCIDAPHPYRLQARDHARARPQIARFMDWLWAQSRDTEALLGDMSTAVDKIQARGPVASSPRSSA